MEKIAFVGGSGHQSLHKMTKPQGFIRWGFVRHPGERLVSVYHAVTQHRKIPNPMSFEEFVERLHEGDPQPIPGCRDHLQPQVAYLCDWKTKRLLADFVGRFESIDRDWAYVCRMLRVSDVALPHRNPSKHLHWPQHYNTETMRMMERIYAEDFDRFRYSLGGD